MYQAQRPARSAFLPIRLHRYHVLAWGDAASTLPPLVLVHGWMDVAASYQFMVDALSPEFVAGRLIVAPDWRGFGQSSGPAYCWRNDAMASADGAAAIVSSICWGVSLARVSAG